MGLSWWYHESRTRAGEAPQEPPECGGNDCRHWQDVGWVLEEGMVTFPRLLELQKCLDNAQAQGGIFGKVLWGQELGLILVGPFQLEIFFDFMKTSQTRGSSWPLSMELKTPCGSLPAETLP